MELKYTTNDEEIAKIFKDLGFKINEARVLVIFFKGTELTSRDVEGISNLPQSEVSVALTDLLKKQWIQITRLSTENKGRPVKIYKLSLSIDEVIDQFESEIAKDVPNKVSNLARIRIMIKEATDGLSIV